MPTAAYDKMPGTNGEKDETRGNSVLCSSPAENRDLQGAETGDGNRGLKKMPVVKEQIRGT